MTSFEDVDDEAYEAAKAAFDTQEKRYFREDSLRAAIRAYVRVLKDRATELRESDGYDTRDAGDNSWWEA